MLEIIKTRNNKEVIDAMIEGRQASVWSMIKHDREKINFDEDALIISEWGVSIKTHIFMNQMLDIDDDFAQVVNEVLYNELEKDNAEELLDLLEKYKYDIDREGYLCGSGYTYNETDYCSLDRDIVYHIFEHEGDPYALIQVHYGADARVGFGAMVCFKINDIDYFFDGMDYSIYNRETEEDYCKFDDNIDYDEKNKIWIDVISGNEVEFYTSANGF